MRGGSRPEAIAIAGAGIAGLSAAIALKLAGYPVTVYEREMALQVVGAGIQLGPNATRILEEWDIALLTYAFEPDHIELRNARSGRLLNCIPLHRAARARYGSPYVTLMRTDLQAVLKSRTEELGIPISYGTAIESVKKIDGGVVLGGGTEPFEAAALIGADGLNSKVRALLRMGVRTYSAHTVAWRAMLPMSALPAPFRSVISIWMGAGAHLVHYPVSGGSALNAVLVIDDGHLPEDPHVSPPDYFRLRLRGWTELPLAAIASTDAWVPWSVYGVEKSGGGWGRVQLLGDAWHAMFPYLASGAVMAIEDAHALAQALASGRPVPRALQYFREQRGPRVWRVASGSAQAGRVYHCPPPFDRIRDLIIRTATGGMLLAQNDWLYGK